MAGTTLLQIQLHILQKTAIHSERYERFSGSNTFNSLQKTIQSI